VSEDPKDAEITAPDPPQALALPSGYGLTVHTNGGEKLELHAPDGRVCRVCLRVVLTKEGPMVELETASLSIVSHGSMHLAGRDVKIDAADALSIRSGGDVRIESLGDLSTKALSQTIEASRGEVRVKASDDVRVDGERIRLNAPDSTPQKRSK
jgi:hypothetical protein